MSERNDNSNDERGLVRASQRSGQVSPMLLSGEMPPPRDPAVFLRRVPVAVYKDPYADLRRSFIWIMLIVVLPLAAILLAVFSLTDALKPENKPVAQTTSERVLKQGAPVPSGIRMITEEADGIYLTTGEVLAGSIMKGYLTYGKQTSLYVSGMTEDNILNYYAQKLVTSPDKKSWQWYDRTKRTSTLGNYYMFVRDTNNTRLKQAIVVQLEPLTAETYRSRVSLLGNNAQVGDTLVFLYRVDLVSK